MPPAAPIDAGQSFDRVFTVAELAKRAGVMPRAIYRDIRKGVISIEQPAGPNGKIYILRAVAAAYLRS